VSSTLATEDQPITRSPAPPDQPTPDAVVADPSVATASAAAENGSGEAQPTRSPAPPDQEADVVVATPPPALATSAGDDQDGSQVTHSPPPADQITDAIVATPPADATAAALETAAIMPLSLKDADYDDDLGDTDSPPAMPSPELGIELDNQAMYRIIREVAVIDSGDDAYSAVSPNREFTTVGQPAYQKRQFGLGFGLILFTQESGHLGRLLALTKQRDPGAFASTFGSDADALIATTLAGDAARRLQPVGGEPLWLEPWLARFRAAGKLQACQLAQNQEAIEGFFRPMLRIAFDLGFRSDRGLAMVFDRVVVRGLGGGLDWVVAAASSLRTEGQRQHALDMLGYASLDDFQSSVSGLARSGRFDTETHSALTASLRKDGRMPMPTDAQLQCGLLAAAGGAARQRLLRLRDSTVLQDVNFKPAG
jgi:hypothetical protein